MQRYFLRAPWPDPSWVNNVKSQMVSPPSFIKFILAPIRIEWGWDYDLKGSHRGWNTSQD